MQFKERSIKRFVNIDSLVCDFMSSLAIQFAHGPAKTHMSNTYEY